MTESPTAATTASRTATLTFFASAAEAFADRGVHRLWVGHRVGKLVVGDVAFLVAASASHRAEAFEACSWLVEEVKRDIPVWKRQVFPDGTHEWSNSA